MKSEPTLIELPPRMMPEAPFALRGKRHNNGSVRYAYSAVLFGVILLALSLAVGFVLVSLIVNPIGSPLTTRAIAIMSASTASLAILSGWCFGILHEVVVYPDGSVTYRHRRLLRTRRVHAAPGEACLEYCDLLVTQSLIGALVMFLKRPLDGRAALIAISGTGVAIHSPAFTVILAVTTTDDEAAHSFGEIQSVCRLPERHRVIRVLGGPRSTRAWLRRITPGGEIWHRRLS
jgi:hypothetical protein